MIAAERVKNPGILDILHRWIEKKYNLPWTHNAFQELTLLELLTMFWEDYYQKHPVDARRTKDGHVVFSNTGDSLIDKWEKEIAMGLDPDLLEGVSVEEREKERRAFDRLRQVGDVVKRLEVEEGFSDDYLATKID